ncbi:MAG: flagellar basal body-associated FliL family protein [Pseudomonadota bacterium]
MADNEQAEAPKGKKSMIIVIVLVAVIAGGAGIAVPMLLNKPAETVAGEEEVAEAETPPGAEALYRGIHPPLLINFLDERGKGRFLQMSLEVMSRDQAVIDAMEAHDAVVRSQLILLFGDVKLADLNSREGKANLLVMALDEINRILTEQTGAAGVEAVYFTNLVVQ